MSPQKTISACSAFLLAIFAFSPIYCQEPQDENSRQSERALTILYTKANLSMAELELAQAMELNSGDLQIVPRLTIERMRSNVAIAKEQYEHSKLTSDEGPQQLLLRHAEEKVRLAAMDLVAGDQLKVNKVINEWEHKRLELKLDLAKLNLALMQHPRGYMTFVDSMQRQIDRLGVEILALDQRLSKLEGR